METRRVISGAILPVMVFLFVVSFSSAARAIPPTASLVKSNLGNLSVHFLPVSGSDRNAGPAFVAEGLAYSAWLSAREVKLGLRFMDKAGENRIGRRRVSMQFLETSNNVRLVGRDSGGAVAHFLMGQPKDWVRNVALYKKVHYQDLWPGIDTVFYGRLNNLEFDFILQPGADLSRIKLRFQGVDSLRVDADGRLMLKIGDRELPLSLPHTYQENPDGKKETLGCRFLKVGPDTVGVEVQNHNPALAMVIDPIIHFSTYMGGGENWYTDSAGHTDDFGRSVDVDNDGNVYVAGVAESSDFFQNRYLDYPGDRRGCRTLFIAKFDPDGDLIYSTRLHANWGSGIKVDALGQVYVAGDISDDIMPVVGGFQEFPGSSARPPRHGFLVKINTAGDSILYSTYFGGDLGHDMPNDLAIDPDGCAYVVGTTSSSDFTSRNPLMENLTRPVIEGREYDIDDIFVVKIDTNAAGDDSLLFATTLGGTYYDRGFGIDIDSDRNIYIVGETLSKDFQPLVGPLQDTFEGCATGFLAKINATCDAVVYSTFLSEKSAANDVAVEDSGHAYVVGTTIASDRLPGLNGFKEFPLDVDPFLVRIDTNLTGAASLVYATYLGGTGVDEAFSVVTNGRGWAYVTGWTSSEDLPGVPASDPINGRIDVFYSLIDTSRVGEDSLLEAAYIGGSLNDRCYDVALGPLGEIVVTGGSVSRDFPTVAAFQGAHADAGDEEGQDAFVCKMIQGSYRSLPVTDLPDGGGTFWYPGTTSVRVFGEARYHRPVAWSRQNSNQLSLSIGLPVFEKDVDVYLTLQHKNDPKLLYFVDGRGRLISAVKTPVPWKKSTNNSFRAFKSRILTFNDLPAGDWNMALTVTPEGRSFEKAPYRWETETGVRIVQTKLKLPFLPVTKTAESVGADAGSATDDSGYDASSGGCFLSSLM